MKKKYLLQLVLCMVPGAMFAQQHQGLRTYITYGLKNHRSTHVYANGQLIAKAQAKEALADYLPSVDLNGSVDDNLKLQQSVIPAGIFGPEPVRVSLTQKFNTNAFVQLDQTIFDQSLITGLKANKYNVQLAALDQLQNDERIIYNISTAYYQVLVYREQLALLQANRETYQQQLDVSQLQVKKGVMLEVDMNRILVNYNNTLSQITVAESNLSLSENQLKNEMNYPLEQPLLIDTVVARPETEFIISGDTTGAFAEAGLTSYRLSQVNLSLLDIDSRRIRAEAFPRLSFTARYGTTGFGDKLGESFRETNDYSSIGLRLAIPLFNGFKRSAQYRQAKYKWENARENLAIDGQKYRLDYENARTQLIKAQSNLQNDKRNKELALSVFATTDLQYNKGVTSLTEWLNAQNALKESQNNYLSSLYSFYRARIDLERANGTLKHFYNAL